MEFGMGLRILGEGGSAAGKARVGASCIKQINMNPRARFMCD
jgi:hypothetical protein